MNIIFDLDGTLADCVHRLHFIKGDKKDWRGFHEACINDSPIEPMIMLARQLRIMGNNVRIWSGRNDSVREQTENWLNSHHVFYEELRMRPDKDFIKDCKLKERWLLSLPRDRWPDLIFDDRQQVVDMWRSHGIRVCQVANGNF